MVSSGLTERFDQAYYYARRLHQDQIRKGSQTPYIGHLLGVAALVIEQGGDEDQAIAALLHDAVEDQGGLDTLSEIRSRFGERVAEIVAGCTDAFTEPKPPWRKRKKDYLQHLKTANPDIWLVSLADKVHNARSIVLDLRADGEDTWRRFKGGKEGTLWYYRALAEEFNDIFPGPLATELQSAQADIEKLASE
jgi:GTP pyrophosphokinase